MKVNKNFNYSILEKTLYEMEGNHSSSATNTIKKELNKCFTDLTCREVIYTNNHDKLFFGMRIYPHIDGDLAVKIITSDAPISYTNYFVEFDSKLFDPMLNLTERELTAVLLHEIGHIVGNPNTTDEVRKNVDMYFTNSDDSLQIQDTVNYKEVLAYAMKDSVMKVGSMFTKIGYTEIIADSFAFSCGYGDALESSLKKLLASSNYVNKDVDNRLITLAWALRLYKEMKIKRLPAIRTLNRAKSYTASELEKREIQNAINNLNRIDDLITEGAIDNVKARLIDKVQKFKKSGIRSIKDDIYEFNLRLRAIETEEDAMLLIRNINSDIAVLEDYMTEPQVSDQERESISDVLEELYAIRVKAAKTADIRNKYSSMIQVVYPNIQ